MNRIYIKITLVVFLLSKSLLLSAQIINTFAGNGHAGFSGDGGQATDAEFHTPVGVAVDAHGNIYIADCNNELIRKINTSGIISTFAGNGYMGYAGDGAQATTAEFYQPIGVAVDASGNVYIADANNNKVRIVNTSGIINTFAGTGAGIYSGDGGPATAAGVAGPSAMTSDASGNIYIADCNNFRIRIVYTSGIINTLAGNGVGSFSGDGGPATAAELNHPYGITVDASGNMYISDDYNYRVREVNSSGIINTIAGNGAYGYSGDGGQATSAEFYFPRGVVLDVSGNVYIADENNNRIRVINTSGIISTFAGDGYGSPGSGGYSGDGGPATNAELYQPYSVAMDAAGNIYMADQGNNRIRKITGITTGINNLSYTTSEITIYPIPTTGIFTISGISQGQVIEIYNYTGQKILSALNHQLTANFDISSYTNGIYLVRILSKDGSVVATKKILKTE